MIVTHSDMQKFAACRRLWWFASYRGLKREDEPRTGAMPLGSRVHLALEAYYDGTVEDPLIAWVQLMDHEYAVAAETGAFLDDLDKENKLGTAMLGGYLEWAEAEGEDADFDVIGVEAKLSNELVVDTPRGPLTLLVRGKLDRRLRRKADGAIFVGDFKTTGNFGAGTILSLVRSPQPRQYMLLEQQQLGDKAWTAGAVFTLLRKVQRTKTSNPPYYLREIVRISAHDLDQYRIRMEGMAAEMAMTAARLDAGEDHRRVAYFQPSWQCGTCPFQQPCIAYQADSERAAEDMLADRYVATDPWERYREETGEEVSV